MLFLEIIAVVLNVAFVILMAYERTWGWIPGILGSLISAGLFFSADLYSEGALYVLYAVLGVYGWLHWKQGSVSLISTLPLKFHGALIGLALGIGLISGLLLQKFSKAALPLADALSSSFSLLATWLEARKILHHWWYWILINLFSVWLYAERGLYILATQMVLFFLLSVWGWFRWKAKFAQQ